MPRDDARTKDRWMDEAWRKDRKESSSKKDQVSSRKDKSRRSMSRESSKSSDRGRQTDRKKKRRTRSRSSSADDGSRRETSEERRARRLQKKIRKEQRRAEREKEQSVAAESFGDPDLHKTFVWKKALEKKGQAHLSVDEIKKLNKQKQKEMREELEKVHERRQQYEREKAAREEEAQLVQREKEAAQFKLWEGQEDSFHLKQAQLRSEIRIRDGRAKPIDLLAQYIREADDLSVDIHEPYTYIEGLSKRDLEDLIEDIRVYKNIDMEENIDYWDDVTVVTEEELNKVLRDEAEAERRAGRQGINSAVAADVSSVFKSKTYPQLVELEKEIRKKISGRSEGVDVSYWENLLQQIRAHMARIRLRERHQVNLKKKLENLKKEQGIQDDFKIPEVPSTSRSAAAENTEVEPAEDDEEETLDVSEYRSGRYSPRLIPFSDLDVDIHLVDVSEDLRKLELAREQVSRTGSAAIVTTEDHIFEREAKKGMGDDEAQFSVETSLDTQSYVWSDKYRPRKPRYFNRVHTGFEWNKYNQTHYDLDNPPPKVVQGYKFNIFYPDLIDKQKTPEYVVTPCKDNTDFAILRISAGPPYEDIAFKIVNREWEFSYKRGFRCQFHNNIFQLWFHFKRYRYRR